MLGFVVLDFTFMWAELLDQYLAVFSHFAQVASKLSDTSI